MRFSGYILLCCILFQVSCGSLKTSIPADKDLNTVPDRNQVGARALPDKIAAVKAPFAIRQFAKPVFPALTITVKPVASSNGLHTKAIQDAIDEVSSQDGGTVIIPAGEWRSGRIMLKSNVNLHLADSAVIFFSGEVEDYRPAVFTRFEGIEVMSLGACIYANGQRNIAITGKGKLVGPAKNGSISRQARDTIVTEDLVPYTKPVKDRVFEGFGNDFVFRPMFISPINCQDVYIEGITLEKTAFWNIVPVYCDGVIIRGVTVNSVGVPRGDGIDIESSRNVLIEYCTLNCGDDCFTIKAGRAEDGKRVNIPSENIIVRYSLAGEGHGGVTVGSETAAMIRNLYVHDCVFENTRTGLRFKTRRPRGGGGENLYYERIRMDLSGPVFEWDMLGIPTYVGDLAKRLPVLPVNALTPQFKNITARNLIVSQSSQFIKATAIPETPLENVLIENVSIRSARLIKAADVNGFVLRNATIETKDSVISLLDTRNLLFENVRFNIRAKNLQADVTGPESSSIEFKNCIPAKPTGWQDTKWKRTSTGQ